MTNIRAFSSALAATVLTLTLSPGPASACGGLFCNSSNPVNQAAERIIFSQNGDGTVTAIIEIQYEGPPENFSWVLPVPGVPDVAVSSTVALDRLQQVTNPQYFLQTSFDDSCDFDGDGSGADSLAMSGAAGSSGGESGIIVLAAGTVGPFDYEVISLDEALPTPPTPR